MTDKLVRRDTLERSVQKHDSPSGSIRDGFRALFRHHGLEPHESLIGDLIQRVTELGKPSRFAVAFGKDLDRCVRLLSDIRSAAGMSDNAEVMNIPEVVRSLYKENNKGRSKDE